MTLRDDLRAAARDWLLAVSGVTDDKLVYDDADGPRPDLPYLTVQLITPGRAVAPAERVDDTSDGTGTGSPRTSMRSARTATLTVQGYGSGSLAWLTTADELIDSPASLDQQLALGVSIDSLTGPRDISKLVSTRYETRYTLDLAFRYKYTTTPAAATALQTARVSVSAVRYNGDGSPLSVVDEITAT